MEWATLHLGNPFLNLLRNTGNIQEAVAKYQRLVNYNTLRNRGLYLNFYVGLQNNSNTILSFSILFFNKRKLSIHG